MKHTIIFKKINSPTLHSIKTKATYRCELGKLIGAERVEIVRITEDGLLLFVDEDGYGKDLSHNFFLHFPYAAHPIQTIIGDVIFARLKAPKYIGGEPWDYEIDSVKETDYEVISKILSDDYQSICRCYFESLYKSTESPEGYWGYTVTEIKNIKDYFNQ